MNTSIILVKAPRGHDEIATRAHRLSPLARRLLIIADGQRTVAELAAELDREMRDTALHEALRFLLDDQYLCARNEYDEVVRSPLAARFASPSP